MNEHPSDADPLARRLRSERPELGAAELGDVRRRVVGRAPSRTAGRSSAAMVTACLGLGVLFSGSGTALAVSGLAGDGSALRQQYEPPAATAPAEAPRGDAAPTLGGDAPTAPADAGDVAGETASGADDTGAGTDTAPADTADDASGVAGASASGGDDSGAVTGDTSASSPSALDATGQFAATQGADAELPFTGLDAIPLLLIGVALMVVGMTLRRRTAAG